MMKEQILVICTLIAISTAQIPGVGWCPDKRAMPGFDIDRYLGTWYEAERYFTVLEAGSRCARTNYTKAVDGRILVTNEITNRLTGIKRVLDGEIRNVPKGGVDSKISVKYSTLPFPMETEYIILDTDYDSYSVVWSCSGLGPIVNTQTAWVMTRERLPPGTVLQKAYAVLDKHKISRTFFVRAEQEECNLGEVVAQKSRSTEVVNQNAETTPVTEFAQSSSSPPSSSVSATATEAASTSKVNEEEQYMQQQSLHMQHQSLHMQHQQPPLQLQQQQKHESLATSSPAGNVNSESSHNAEVMAKPDSNDTVRKPAPAVTAAPPAQFAQNAAVTDSNSVVNEHAKPVVSSSVVNEHKN